MKTAIKILLATGFFVILGFSGAIVQAGGWDNFKLRYFALTSYLGDRDREFTDLYKQNIDPEKHSRIDLAELLNGGPPKDGIPSIDDPKFDTVQTTPFSADEIVIGVVVNGEAKAYPFGIMNWHEIVNDSLGGMNITVSYCPLCDTIVVFNRGNSTYGVSGKLYQSCLIMYDRADDTLYSQPWAMGVVGEKVNVSLEKVHAVKTTLGNWLNQHPNSQILSTETGHDRDYLRYPYGTYYTNSQLIFPVRNQDRRTLSPKTIVSYVWEPDRKTPHNQFSGVSAQFVHTEIEKLGQQMVQLGDRQIRARWDNRLNTVIVEELDGTPIPSSTAFAFVYPAFFAQ